MTRFPSDEGSPRYRAPALEKGLDILELLADRPEGLSQSEIARSLERSVGEIFRMLACLVDRGYLSIQRPSDRYVITLKLFELAHRHAPLQQLIASALPRMRDLAAKVHQSCHLTVVETGHGVVVAQADAPGEIGFAVRVGAVVDLLSTASGRVLLAFQPTAERERILALDPESRSRRALAREVEDVLQTIRSRGYEDMESTRIRGVHDLSFPVLDPRACAVAAMTMPFIARLDVEDVSLGAARGALADTARGLSAALGAPAGEGSAAEAAGVRILR
ncbi:MAG TPA: IclR family transcriptional regulator [Planctomycetota bacterium]|jgi:DNA-binding IclR family transcriptional regulator|nr:IclR family transcriptional regulator [Planctomycetota bacterium]